MQLNIVVPLVVTVVIAATGYGATYLTNLRLTRRKDHLDRVNRQLSELYGPLYAQSTAVDQAWEKFEARYRTKWVASAPTTAEWAATWRLWMSTVFMPLNRRMVETIVTHADLLIEDTIPDSLKELCAHVACYEPIVAGWQEEGFDSVQYGDHVSIAGNFPHEELSVYLQESFESLKREQAWLLARMQRLGLTRGSKETEQAAIRHVMALERRAGRDPKHVRRSDLPYDIKSPPRMIEVKAFSRTARSKALLLEHQQVEAARVNPEQYYLYVVDNVAGADGTEIGVRTLHGEALLAMIKRTQPQIRYQPTIRAAEYDQAERLQ
ncbi:DUF3883 domain-containing protein [Streptomyces sp. NPDC005281]|uniref:DUF3883 domain-containing protein n=1 Tax=Streptomyces sp. NPDC005281 TaxID=3155712 RepID=UPI0033B4501C